MGSTKLSSVDYEFEGDSEIFEESESLGRERKKSHVFFDVYLDAEWSSRGEPLSLQLLVESHGLSEERMRKSFFVMNRQHFERLKDDEALVPGKIVERVLDGKVTRSIFLVSDFLDE